jgi:hypothetical protein
MRVLRPGWERRYESRLDSSRSPQSGRDDAALDARHVLAHTRRGCLPALLQAALLPNHLPAPTASRTTTLHERRRALGALRARGARALVSVTANRRINDTTVIRDRLRSPIDCTSCEREITGIVVWHARLLAPLPFCESCFRELEAEIERRVDGWLGLSPKTHQPTPLHTARCVWCGGLVAGWRRRSTLSPPFCSDGCQHARELVRRRVKHEPRACAVCGESFTPKRSDARYCSPTCRQRAHRERRARGTA